MHSTLITAGSHLAFLGLLGLLIGCGSRPVAKQPPPSPPPVVVDPPSAPSVAPTDPGPTDVPTEPAAPLNILSDSPLDLVEQGRLYRAAMEKFDEGDLTFVIDARERLQDDELYRLMQAVEREMAAINSRMQTLEDERKALSDQVKDLQQQLDQRHEQDLQPPQP